VLPKGPGLRRSPRFRPQSIHLVAPLVVMAIIAAVLPPVSADAAQLTLSWVDHSGGLAAFSIERRATSGGTYTPIGQQPAGISTYVDTTVAAGSTYCYRVRAFNDAGMSGYSNEACASPAGGLDLTVTRAGSGTGTVTSSPPGIDCGQDCAESYAGGTVVTLAAAAGPGSAFSAWSGSGCAGVQPCVLTGNTAVLVTATFVATPAPSDTQPPSRPPRIRAWASGSTRITVAWGKPSDNVGVTGYHLERCMGFSCATFVRLATPAGTTFSDTGLAPSTRYRYRVRAIDAAGNLGPYSAVASARTGRAPGNAAGTDQLLPAPGKLPSLARTASDQGGQRDH
jgi:hypothetical protein